MEGFEQKKPFELNPYLGLPNGIFPRYPPGVASPMLGVMNQNKIKEKFFREHSSMSMKLSDFNQMYQKFASGLFEVAYPALPPGHPLFSRQESTATLKSENDKLRKENLELKKQLDKKQKPQH